MAEAEITAFLSHLAVKKHVTASTQNQALSALLFLYKEVLKKPLEWMDRIERAKKPSRLPVVFTQDEVRSIMQRGRSPQRRGDRRDSAERADTLRLSQRPLRLCGEFSFTNREVIVLHFLRGSRCSD